MHTCINELVIALEQVMAMISPDGEPDAEGNVYRIDVIDEECEYRLKKVEEALRRVR